MKKPQMEMRMNLGLGVGGRMEQRMILSPRLFRTREELVRYAEEQQAKKKEVKE